MKIHLVIAILIQKHISQKIVSRLRYKGKLSSTLQFPNSVGYLKDKRSKSMGLTGKIYFYRSNNDFDGLYKFMDENYFAGIMDPFKESEKKRKVVL